MNKEKNNINLLKTKNYVNGIFMRMSVYINK